MGPELRDVDFVVVDLETTGTNPERDAITEIGAVRVVGGTVVEEFQTFVDPERDIPAYIARLTGITNHMVKDAPTAEAVIPMFLEFARTSVLVAHNARFDIGFLKTTSIHLGYAWPNFDIVDTLALARRTFGRDEVSNHKLGTLAAAVGATTVPNHRALSDARATVDVLHAAIARLGHAGASHLSDLTSGRDTATPAQIRKRYLAAKIPSGPGVYSFIDDAGDVLYVGKSLNVRSRVRTYFSAQEKRRAVLDIMPVLSRVEVTPCTSETDAAIRELRLISEHKPRANRQGIRPSTGNWLRLGPGAQGLRLARKVTPEADGSTFIGPLRSRHDVEPIRSFLYAYLPAQECSPERAEPSSHASGSDSLADPGYHERMRRTLTCDPAPVFRAAATAMRASVARGDFERAAAIRERATLFLTAAARANQLRAIARVPLLIAARRVPPPSPPPTQDSPPEPWAWEIFTVRWGRLVDSRLAHQWEDPLTLVPVLTHTAQESIDSPSPLAFGHHQETELILQWIKDTGTRIVHCEGEWSTPAGAAFTNEALVAHFGRARTNDLSVTRASESTC